MGPKENRSVVCLKIGPEKRVRRDEDRLLVIHGPEHERENQITIDG